MPYSKASVVVITLGHRAGVKPVRIVHWLVALYAASQCCGCASSRVGLQADGTYILERGEQSADCQVLHKNIWGRIQLLKGIPEKARAEQQTVPRTASSLFGRWFGGSNRGLDALAEYDRERAHVYALRRTMVEKKCIAVDVDAELAGVAAEMAAFRPN